MKIYVFLLFSFFVILKSVKSITENDTKLVMIQAMFRHGARTPLVNYPNDTKASLWDKFGGLGQLTPIGMKQLNEYGKFFKNKYQKFLNPSYDISRVFVKSSDVDRTLQSAYTFLSGVYQPNSDQAWTSESNLTGWMPIPVHTTDSSNDNIFHTQAPCQRFDELANETRSSPKSLALIAANQKFIDNMRLFSGITNLNYFTMWQLYDKAAIEKAYNLTLDKYIEDNYDKIVEITDNVYSLNYDSIEYSKLTSGGLLNDMVSNINKKISGSKIEFQIYSAHDSYVAAMQKLLNTSTVFSQPNFASSFVLELRNDTSGKYYVQVLFKNNPYPGPIVLTPVTVYGCETICPLDQFLKIVSDKLVTDFTEICKSKTQSQTTTVSSFIQSIMKLITSILSLFKA